MNLFNFFRPSTLTPAWTFSADGVIWRLVFAPGGRLIGESRDREKKAASFFCLDLIAGKPLWKNLALDEPWWIGIESVHNSTLLLHGFVSPDMPEHRGIQAFDVGTGQRLWEDETLTYWFGGAERLFAYRDFFDKRVGYEIEIRSGSIIATHDSTMDELNKIRQEIAGSAFVPEVTIPEPLDDEADPIVMGCVNHATKGMEVVGGIEYAKSGGFMIFDFNVRSEGRGAEPSSLENILAVYELPGRKRIFFEVTARGLKSRVPDVFFICNETLFFVKDQRTLTAIRLWKS